MEKDSSTGFSSVLLMGVKLSWKQAWHPLNPVRFFIKTGRSPRCGIWPGGDLQLFRKVKDMTSWASWDFLVHLLGKRVSLRWWAWQAKTGSGWPVFSLGWSRFGYYSYPEEEGSAKEMLSKGETRITSYARLLESLRLYFILLFVCMVFVFVHVHVLMRVHVCVCVRARECSCRGQRLTSTIFLNRFPLYYFLTLLIIKNKVYV